MLDAEQLRVSLAAFGDSLWTARPHQASQLLCAWNAFALQTLGDQLVEADYQADSRTIGYLPPVTAELWSPDATDEIHEKVENSLRRGIAAYYRLGQLLAMPALLEQPEISAIPVAGASLPLSGQPGFDPWCLTDPASRSVWEQDPAACRAIEMLWLYDPDPAATLSIQSQIDAAAAAGSIVLGATIGNAASHYFCCPWAAIYTVRRPVIIAGQRMRSMQQFTFDVSAEEMAEGGEFIRGQLP